jgi:hypothetical protein
VTPAQFNELLDAIRELKPTPNLWSSVVPLIAAFSGALVGFLASLFLDKRRTKADESRTRSNELRDNRLSIKRALVKWTHDTVYRSPRRYESGKDIGGFINDLRVDFDTTGDAKDSTLGEYAADVVRAFFDRPVVNARWDADRVMTASFDSTDRAAVDGARDRLIEVLNGWVNGGSSTETVFNGLMHVAQDLRDSKAAALARYPEVVGTQRS